jgi:hypothetical protein
MLFFFWRLACRYHALKLDLVTSKSGIYRLMWSVKHPCRQPLFSTRATGLCLFRERFGLQDMLTMGCSYSLANLPWLNPGPGDWYTRPRRN